MIDLETLSGLDELATAQAAAEGIADRGQEVASLVRRAAASAVIRQAVTGRFWREVPVAGVVNGVLVEGYIDLVYEVDGGLGIVDYKTDSVSRSRVQERMQQYEVQGETYRILLEEVSQLPVGQVTFVFAGLEGLEATVSATTELRQRVLTSLAHPAA
jgi:ATP-dependent exoDNAse (exonuclease V) beta subunit